jgi:hypothetical protein
LGTVSNFGEILARFQLLTEEQQSDGNYWSETVRQYVVDKAYPRQQEAAPGNTNFLEVIYNGEKPLGLNGNQLKKRQGSSPSSCIPSASASASLVSISLASVASVNSVVSVSSAAARASRTATAIQPTLTGYLGDVCTKGPDGVNLPDTALNQGVANTTWQQFCSGVGFWTWMAADQPPAIKYPPNFVVSGPNVTFKSTPPLPGSQEVTTDIVVGPYDGAGACSVGGYPRSLSHNECAQAFAAVLNWCKYQIVLLK